MGPRACEGQLPGGSGNGPFNSRATWRARFHQLSARQPGQPKVLVSFQGCSELLGGDLSDSQAILSGCHIVWHVESIPGSYGRYTPPMILSAIVNNSSSPICRVVELLKGA